jgi:hypothetical protein
MINKDKPSNASPTRKDYDSLSTSSEKLQPTHHQQQTLLLQWKKESWKCKWDDWESRRITYPSYST